MPNESMRELSRLNADRNAAFEHSLEKTQQSTEALENLQTAESSDIMEGKLLDAAEGNSALAITIRSKKLEGAQVLKTEKAKKAQESVLVRKEEADGLAGQFSQRHGNREYQLDAGLLSQLAAEELGAGIHENSTPDEIIALIRKRMMVNGQLPDVAIVDKAFEFLVEVTKIRFNTLTGTDKTRVEKILQKLEGAKNKHFEANAVDIQVAQKIIGAVDAVTQKTGESVKSTLQRYREVVHTPPDLQTLRRFYEEKGYKAMILELKGLNAYLGGNFKRTNLDNPELAQLAAAARKMQALLGVFRETKGQLNIVESYLSLHGIFAA